MNPAEYQRRVVALESARKDLKVKFPASHIMALIGACRYLDLTKRHLFYEVKPDVHRVEEYERVIDEHEALARHLEMWEITFEKIADKLPPRLIHALLGMATEVGEMWEAVVASVRDNQPFDLDNLHEELGDSFWYHALAIDEAEKMNGFRGRFCFEQITDANIAKLEQRRAHAGGVSAHGGDRDLQAEKEVMRKAQDAGHQTDG